MSNPTPQPTPAPVGERLRKLVSTLRQDCGYFSDGVLNNDHCALNYADRTKWCYTCEVADLLDQHARREQALRAALELAIPYVSNALELKRINDLMEQANVAAD